MDGNHTISWYDYQWYEIHDMHALLNCTYFGMAEVVNPIFMTIIL